MEDNDSLNDALVLRVQRLGASMARKFGLCGTLREELISTGLVALVEAQGRFESKQDEEHFKRYLTVRVRGAMVDFLRKFHRVRGLGFDEYSPSVEASIRQPQQESVLLRGELCERLRDALSSLAPSDRELVERTILKDESVSDYAHNAGLSTGYVSKIRSRLLQRLRKLLLKTYRPEELWGLLALMSA